MSQVSTDFIGEVMAESFRGNKKHPNPNNVFTKGRRLLTEKIKNASEDENEAIKNSLAILSKNVKKLQDYVMSKGETPASSLIDLSKQVYQLRQGDIRKVADAMEVSFPEAQIFIEDSEASAYAYKHPESDSFLGNLSAPVFVIAGLDESVEGVDNFINPELISGILNTAGTKINASSLLRAAQNKPAGVMGTLSTGGAKLYNQLRAYFQKNPKIAADVINGKIRSIEDTGFYGSPEKQQSDKEQEVKNATKFNASDVLNAVRKAETKKAINKALPFIIGGVVLIILVVFLIAKNASKK